MKMNPDDNALVFILPFSLLSVSGEDRVSFLHNILSQDIASMQVGEWRETALLSATSHVLAYMTAIKTDTAILLLSIEGQAESISNHLNRFVITEDIQIDDISSQWQLLEVWGPQKESFLKKLGVTARIDGQNYFKGSRALLPLSETIPEGSAVGSSSSREMLRIENGMLAYEKDFDQSIMLSETLLEKISASETKGCYPGQEVVAKIETYKRLNRCFVKLIWEGHPEEAKWPAKGSAILDIQTGAEIGRLTSRTYSPFLKKNVGLGWLKRGYFDQPSEVIIHSEKNISAQTKLLSK